MLRPSKTAESDHERLVIALDAGDLWHSNVRHGSRRRFGNGPVDGRTATSDQARLDDAVLELATRMAPAGEFVRSA